MVREGVAWPSAANSCRGGFAAIGGLIDLAMYKSEKAKLKALLRKAAARSVEEIIKTIGTVLDNFTADECANYFVNSGYAPT